MTSLFPGKKCLAKTRYNDDFLLHQNKKDESPSEGGKCHAKTMIHNEAGQSCKINSHNVPFKKSVEEIRPGKTEGEGVHDESERSDEGEV